VSNLTSLFTYCRLRSVVVKPGKVDRETLVGDTTPAIREWTVFQEEEVPGEVLMGTERDEKSNDFQASKVLTPVPPSPSLSLPLPRPSFAPSIGPFVPSTSPPSHLLYSEPRELPRVLDSPMTSRNATPSPACISLLPVGIFPFELSLDDIPSLREAMSNMSSPCVNSLNGALHI
jgi:hypothetical protein